MTRSPVLRQRVVDTVAEQALRSSGFSPLFARLYAARGIQTATDIEWKLSQLPSPALMRGMDVVCDRLIRAIQQRERMLIVADYDADGATACAVGLRGLRAMGAEVGYIVPNRFEYGYGLTPEIVTLAARESPSVIITVDNGIASVDGVAAARSRGIDVVVTDHHLPGDTLPDTPAIVNPNQPGCPFPSKAIAGVGVMFYVLLALRAQLREHGTFSAATQPDLNQLLDLVALGTVADVVPLDTVNRRLVEAGLRRMREGRACVGINALFDVAKRDAHKATAYDLGFMLGPRINAAGRLDDISLGIECLSTDDPARAVDIAIELDRLNRERKGIEAGMRDEADQMLARNASANAGTADMTAPADTPPATHYSIVVSDPTWHQGVVGIVAGRLREKHHRPTIVFAPGSEGELKGSGRSIPGFHLRDALDLVSKRVPGLMRKFGGHAMAAGLTMDEANFDAFAKAFEQVARESLTLADLEQRVESDGSFSLDEFDFATAEALHKHVWGQAFPAPLFDDEFTVMDARIVGMKHTKLRLKRGGRIFDAIRFGITEPPPQPMRAAYRVSLSEYQGTQRLELIVEQWWAVS
ncbi:MAG: single-stranded-DNA-specific exonuclease RecJ [Burkholderiales bacterium]|nr:single-stranded-DNA-specific exonuclease RecJ [Burkholderiales bacterium]